MGIHPESRVQSPDKSYPNIPDFSINMSEETKKSEEESRAPSAVSFVPTPDDKIFTEISEKVVKSRLTKNKNSVRIIVV